MKKKLTYFGNPVLRKRSEPINTINEEICQIAQDLIDTVKALNGAGLAAPQIGISLRIFVICFENGVDKEGMPIMSSEPQVFINPQIKLSNSKSVSLEEGCLSIPNIREEVVRPETIIVEATGLDGKVFKETATGWRARVIMHENDHLNGVLFIDRLDPKTRKILQPVLRKIKQKI